MAVMLFQGSRCIPRLFSRFSIATTNILAGEASQSVRVKTHICCLSQCSRNTNLCKKISKKFTSTNKIVFTRNFHVSSVYYDEVQIISTPPFADSISEGDVRWEKAAGDFVKEDDVVCEIETDKTSLPVPSPKNGIIEELLVEDGTTVQQGTPLFKLKLSDGAGEAAPKPAAASTPSKTEEAPAQEAKPAAPPSAPPAPSSGPIPTTPPPVPPLPKGPISTTPIQSIKATQATAVSTGAPSIGARTETRVKMNRMRQRIAQRLKDAQNSCAMLTTFNEIDMSNIMEMRTQYKDAFQKRYGLKLGFMSAFVKASAFALQHQPIVNAVIDDIETVYRDYVDISVAVATPKVFQ